MKVFLTTICSALLLLGIAAGRTQADAALGAGDALRAKILAPASGVLLDAPAATVTVQFPQGGTVRLWINEVPVRNATLGRTETDAQTRLTTQSWIGLVLRPGPNTIAVQVVGDGGVGPTVIQSVQVRSVPERLTLTPRAAKLPADDRATVTVLGRLLDHWGNPTAGEAVVFLDTSAGKWLGTNVDPDPARFPRSGERRAVCRDFARREPCPDRAYSRPGRGDDGAGAGRVSDRSAAFARRRRGQCPRRQRTARL